MRTTLDINDDVLLAAKARARREQLSLGTVVSELLRQALSAASAPRQVREATPAYVFDPFPATGVIVTNDMIDALREDDVY